MKEICEIDIVNNRFIIKQIYSGTKTPSYQEEFDTDYDFKKGQLQNDTCLGHWRSVCDIDETFQDKLGKDSSEKQHRDESDIDSSYYDDSVDESEEEEEDISDESDEWRMNLMNLMNLMKMILDDDYEFVNANDKTIPVMRMVLLWLVILNNVERFLKKLGGVYNKSLKGYLFKIIIKETLIVYGHRSIFTSFNRSKINLCI